MLDSLHRIPRDVLRMYGDRRLRPLMLLVQRYFFTDVLFDVAGYGALHKLHYGHVDNDLIHRHRFLERSESHEETVSTQLPHVFRPV